MRSPTIALFITLFAGHANASRVMISEMISEALAPEADLEKAASEANLEKAAPEANLEKAGIEDTSESTAGKLNVKQLCEELDGFLKTSPPLMGYESTTFKKLVKSGKFYAHHDSENETQRFIYSTADGNKSAYLKRPWKLSGSCEFKEAMLSKLGFSGTAYVELNILDSSFESVLSAPKQKLTKTEEGPAPAPHRFWISTLKDEKISKLEETGKILPSGGGAGLGFLGDWDPVAHTFRLNVRSTLKDSQTPRAWQDVSCTFLPCRELFYTPI